MFPHNFIRSYSYHYAENEKMRKCRYLKVFGFAIAIIIFNPGLRDSQKKRLTVRAWQPLSFKILI